MSKYKKGDEEEKLNKKLKVEMDDEMEMKPHFDLSTKQLKAVKDWEVGKTYTVQMKIRQTRKTDEGDLTYACFEVESVKEV